MKKIFSLVLILFLITIGFAFAEGTYEVSKDGPGTKAVERDLASKKFDELARGINDSYLYILAKDANWTLYLYKAYIGMDGTYDGPIYLFQETRKVNKDSMAKEINSTVFMYGQTWLKKENPFRVKRFGHSAGAICPNIAER